jgi:tetratricopeptide (TPR) repeat protein
VERKTRYEQLLQLSDGPYAALTILHARQYVADFPNNGPGWLVLGIALAETARYQEAEQALNQAIQRCQTEKQQIPLSQMGHRFRSAGDYDRAAVWYRKAIEADPNDATYRIFLGAVLARQGNLQAAEVEHRQATQCSEGCIDEAYLNLGLVLRAQDRFEEAAHCFRAAIRLDPNYREAAAALRDVEQCLNWP